MKKILLFLLTACLSFPVIAQSEYISCNRDKTLDYIDENDNVCGILIVSQQYDLVIEIVNATLKTTIKPPRAIEGGLYEHEIFIDANDTREPKVSINRRGNVYKTEFTARVKAGHVVGYRMEEVGNPIRIDDQTTASDAILDEKKAELEFTTSLENLQIDCNESIILEKKSSKKEGDETLTVTSIIIPIDVIKNAEKAIEEAEKAFNAQDEFLKKENNASDEAWQKLDELEKALENAKQHYNELTTVTIYSDNSNKISIDISDMGPRSKKCYVVIPLVIKEEIYKTECSMRMKNGAELFDIRKYQEAKIAFESALNTSDATADIKPTIRTSISLCDSCIRYENIVVKAKRKINALKASGTATQKEVALYASAAIEALNKLNSYKPDRVYNDNLTNLKKTLENMPLYIVFTVVEWKTLYEGNPLSDIEIWAYHGKGKISSNSFSTDKRFRKAVSKNENDYVQLGISDRQGKCKIELNRNQIPTGIIFRPKDNDNVKIYYLDAQQFMRQARGSYMEKQMRIKLYTK